MKAVLIKGDRIYLRSLVATDNSRKYLKWLNDPIVQNFTRRRNRKFTMKDIESFLREIRKSQDYHFAIIIKKSNVHIGNISLNGINEINKSAEVSIMIGEKQSWGKGYGEEAIKLVCSFAFAKLGIHRLWSESPNPAFNTIMKKLKWVKEGIKRKAFKYDNRYLDFGCYSILDNEWGKRA